jgi:hypothetical protein
MNSDAEFDVYQIKIVGTLDPSWSEWLGGLQIKTESQDQNPPLTILTGQISDQTILRGILCKIWDLNFRIISVCQIEPMDEKMYNKGS